MQQPSPNSDRSLRGVQCTLAALLLWTMAACSDSGTPIVPVIKNDRAALEIAQAARPALWRVADDDTTVYLFGTFHALKPDVEWFDGNVRAAYDAADEVALEAIDTQDAILMQQLVLRYAIDPQGRKLSGVISPQTKDSLVEALQSLNVSLISVDAMEPWMATMMLSNLQMIASGYDATLGVDLRLQREAVSQNKKLTGIESTEAQLKMLDGFPEAQQIRWLELTLRDWDKGPKTLDELLALWSIGDIEGFTDAMVESMEEVPDLVDVLLRDRNEGFADWIIERMDEPGTVFFAVGAGHLAGPDSVQDFLRGEGIRVTRH